MESQRVGHQQETGQQHIHTYIIEKDFIKYLPLLYMRILMIFLPYYFVLFYFEIKKMPVAVHWIDFIIHQCTETYIRKTLV